MKISFVIPAYNEQASIQSVIQSIRYQIARTPFDYEIVVVDDDSTDNTADLASESGVDVLRGPHSGNPARLRNEGVKRTSGEILVFLDGDVLLQDGWALQFVSRSEREVMTHFIVTGSVVGIQKDDTNWIIRSWFEPILTKPRRYINSGHLIVSRVLFDAIGGFDESLTTGEDTDFSDRARRVGASIENDSLLSTVHLGYPRTLSEFARRERWHGKGNFFPLNRIWKSKTSLILVTLWVALLISVSTLWVSQTPLIAFSIVFASLTLSMALKRGPISDGRLAQRWVLSSVFFIARCSAVLG